MYFFGRPLRNSASESFPPSARSTVVPLDMVYSTESVCPQPEAPSVPSKTSGFAAAYWHSSSSAALYSSLAKS